MLVKGEKVYLRTIREVDLDELFLYNCDVEARGIYFPIGLDSETLFKKMYHAGNFFTEKNGSLLICDVNTEQILGILYYFKAHPDYNGFEVGYRLFNRANDGRGIVTEALMLCTYLLFVWQSINRIELKIMPENIGSNRVAKKCGYQFESLARQAVFHHGAYCDVNIYSILREEAPKSLEEAIQRLQTLQK